MSEGKPPQLSFSCWVKFWVGFCLWVGMIVVDIVSDNDINNILYAFPAILMSGLSYAEVVGIIKAWKSK